MSRQQRIRMLDVAQAAGVSRTTASYVLNGLDGGIPPDTRRRVLETAGRMGYRANRLAQHLARRRSGLIGLLVPDIASPFFSTLASAMHTAPQAQAYRLLLEIILKAPSDETWLRAIDELLGWSVDGLLVWCQQWANLPELQRHTADTPTVFFGIENFPEEAIDCLYMDLYGGTRAAMDYLLSLGHRQFCFLGQSSSQTDPRGCATMDALATAGLPPPFILDAVPTETARKAIYDLAKSSQLPTAIVCLNDTQALSAFRGLRDAGLRVPQDVSLVSCDQSWAANVVDPALTSLAVPLAEVAERSLEFLLKRMNGEAEGPQRLTLTPTLVVRESAAPPRRSS